MPVKKLHECWKSLNLQTLVPARCIIIFELKDELAMSVMETDMDRLAQRIEAVTNSFPTRRRSTPLAFAT